MPPTTPQFPAVMVLREKGEIVFLDRRARELTGCAPGDARHLRELLGSVFPDGGDQKRALRLFRRAAAAAGQRGAVRFHAEFSAKSGRRQRTTIQVQRWGGEPGNHSYLVSFLPREAPEGDPTAVLRGITRRVARLLEGASTYSQALVAEGGHSDERLALLSALIERAKGLLGSLESPGAFPGEVEERE